MQGPGIFALFDCALWAEGFYEEGLFEGSCGSGNSASVNKYAKLIQRRRKDDEEIIEILIAIGALK